MAGGGGPPPTIGFRFRRSKRRRLMTERFGFKFPCFFLEKETQVSIFCLGFESGEMVGLHFFAFMFVGNRHKSLSSLWISSFLLPAFKRSGRPVIQFPPLPFIITAIYETNTLRPVQIRLDCGLSCLTLIFDQVNAFPPLTDVKSHLTKHCTSSVQHCKPHPHHMQCWLEIQNNT